MSARPPTLNLGPSAASRWTRCTASPGFILRNAHQLPPEKTEYADEGTEAHRIASELLLARDTTGTEVMVAHGAAWTAFVRKQAEPGSRLLVEQKVPLFYNPARNGIVDAAVISPKRIFIGDYKYGVGVSVEAKENEQLAIYAESLLRREEAIEEIADDCLVVLAIFQPRDRNNPEPVRLWALSRAELRAFTTPIAETARMILAWEQKPFVQEWTKVLAEYVAKVRATPAHLISAIPYPKAEEAVFLKAWQEAPSPKPEFKADCDGQCFFCPAKGICSAFASDGLSVITSDVVPPDTLPDPHALTRDQRVRILIAKKALTAWLEAVEDQEMSELLAGAQPLHFKLVEGKSNRQWTDPQAAEKLLRNHLAADEVRPPSDVISPAQAEKALKGKDLSTKFENKLASLITKPPGKPTLAPVSDKRPALEMSPTRGFGNLDAEAEVL